MKTPVEPSVARIKAHLARFIRENPGKEVYRFAAGPGVDAQAARQAGVEVAFEQHVSIVIYVQENEEPTVQQGSETWTRAH